MGSTREDGSMDENTLRRVVREEFTRALTLLQDQSGVPKIADQLQPYLSVEQAAKIANRHRQTVADTLRIGQLHGTQRVRRGTWTVRRDCLDAWMEKRPCEHSRH